MRKSIARILLLWSLFFLISFGLGYPTLRRYDPRIAPGMSDSLNYYAIVVGQPVPHFRPDIFSCRILIPYIARPFYLIARSRLNTWEPVFFGLLVANSLFSASTASLIVSIGRKITGDASIGLIGATIYLLNFALPNLQLAGMVDAGESFFMLMVAWALLTNRWHMLPLVGLLGPLAKETFLPFSAVFMLAWWMAERHTSEARVKRFFWIAAAICLSFLSLLIVRLVVLGHLVWPWQIAMEMNEHVNFFAGLWSCLSDQSFWYVFIWLLPLGVWRLNRWPRPWVVATIATATLVLIFGAYNNMHGSVGRPVFNVAAPLLSLSTALLLTEFLRDSNAEKTK
ncbi:MAG: hypothetical protein AUG51_22915 [Acidobacteria bacterium 13_1_20CM_3_53_8]|nr:MAG: hypothetical protein AUG51_22915 [Acidobacteria bacterium 13_1_20CM_3_53_8]